MGNGGSMPGRHLLNHRLRTNTTKHTHTCNRQPRSHASARAMAPEVAFPVPCGVNWAESIRQTQGEKHPIKHSWPFTRQWLGALTSHAIRTSDPPELSSQPLLSVGDRFQDLLRSPLLMDVHGVTSRLQGSATASVPFVIRGWPSTRVWKPGIRRAGCTLSECKWTCAVQTHVSQGPTGCLQKVKAMKNKGRLTKCHRRKETKEPWQLNALWHFGLDPGTEQGR